MARSLLRFLQFFRGPRWQSAKPKGGYAKALAIRLIEVTNIPVEDRALLQQIQISGWDLFQWKFRLFLKTLCREVHQPGKEGFIRLFQNNPFPFLEWDKTIVNKGKRLRDDHRLRIVFQHL